MASFSTGTEPKTTLRVSVTVRMVGLLLLIFITACGEGTETTPATQEPVADLSPQRTPPASPIIDLIVTGTAAPLNRIPPESVVLLNGLLFDGKEGEPLVNSLIAMTDGKISAVGEVSDFEIPESATVLDVNGLSVLPGLINSHVHGAGSSVRRSFLENGVTTVCEPGGSSQLLSNPPFTHDIQGNLVSRHFISGGWMGPPGGLAVNIPATGAEEVATAVTGLADSGADFIKIVQDNRTVFDVDELSEAVSVAHSRDLLVRMHARHSDMLEPGLTAGVDTVEHIPLPIDPRSDEFTRAVANGVTDLNSLLGDRTDQIVNLYSRVAEDGVILVPTLSSLDAGNVTPTELDVLLQINLDVVRIVNDSAGRIALGTDYGGSQLATVSPILELELLTRAGLSVEEIIRASTRNAAIACGQESSLGTIEPGKLADLIVINGNPLLDMSALLAVETVILGGEIAFSG